MTTCATYDDVGLRTGEVPCNFNRSHFCRLDVRLFRNGTQVLKTGTAACLDRTFVAIHPNKILTGFCSLEHSPTVAEATFNMCSRTSQGMSCFCTGHLCNDNVTLKAENNPFYPCEIIHGSTTPAHLATSWLERNGFLLLVIILAVILSLMIAGSTMFWLYSRCRRRRRRSRNSDQIQLESKLLLTNGRKRPSNDNSVEANLGLDPQFRMNSQRFTLGQLIHHGKFGQVFVGTDTESDKRVIVKLYNAEHRNIFRTENDVLSLLTRVKRSLRNVDNIHVPSPAETFKLAQFSRLYKAQSSLVNYVGWCTLGEQANETKLSNWLRFSYQTVIEYVGAKSLQEHLKSVPLSYHEFLRIGISLMRGLSYLHTNIAPSVNLLSEECQGKPVIAHRDFSSRNIVLRYRESDGEPETKDEETGTSPRLADDFPVAVIVDFGLSERLDQTKSQPKPALNDVGTLPYMAPELLEGSVDLSNVESALKSVDMYAAAVVFWEMTSCCVDFPSLRETPPLHSYHPPLEAELKAQRETSSGREPIVETPVVVLGAPPLNAFARMASSSSKNAKFEFREFRELVAWQRKRPALAGTPSPAMGGRGDAGKQQIGGTRIQEYLLVKQTIEELWDHDPEVRLASASVLHRLEELMSKEPQ